MHRIIAFLPVCALAVTACGGPRPGDVTDLAVAARTGDTARIRALIAAGHDPNARDRGLNHWTPLLHAIHKGRRGAVEALVAGGADVNARAPHPLVMAAGNGQVEILRSLLAAGADPLIPGQELMMVAISGGALTDIENPMLGQCNTEVVRTLRRHAPTLTLDAGFRGHVARWFARVNRCAEVLELEAQGS